MSKKIVSIGLALGAVLMINGCGGSDSDVIALPSTGNTEDPSVTVAEAPTTGVAYYIDSAVAGINYTCGGESGITDADGAFTFEVGSSCTFYLGDVELRSVDAGVLEDGKNVYETDVNIARILMSLDTDGNPDNGITLSAEIIEAIVEAGIEELPDTEEEMEALMTVVEENEGTVVTEDDAQAHLDAVEEEAIAEGHIPTPTPTPAPTATPTAEPTPAPTFTPTTPTTPTPTAPTLEEAVVGKTLYSECNGLVEAMTFGADGVIRGVEGEETFEVQYKIEGNILSTWEYDAQEPYWKPHTYAGSGSTTVTFAESDGGTTTFYLSEADAKANPQTDCGDGDMQPVPANDLVSGQVTFSGFAEATPPISTENAWIRITPTVFANDEGGYNGLQCEIAPDGSFGSNCVIHWDEDGIRQAFTAEGATFTYGIFRDSDDNQMWNCDEDYFGGNLDLSLAEINASITADVEFYDDTRSCP